MKYTTVTLGRFYYSLNSSVRLEVNYTAELTLRYWKDELDINWCDSTVSDRGTGVRVWFGDTSIKIESPSFGMEVDCLGYGGRDVTLKDIVYEHIQDSQDWVGVLRRAA
jgi:hypothetical protein